MLNRKIKRIKKYHNIGHIENNFNNDKTPERIDVLNPKDPWPTRWKYHHIYRYYLAKKYCKNKDVLDVGCGYGYGGFILSKVSRRVVGIDKDKGAINIAQERYSQPNIDFLLMDATDIKLNNCFDTIVSFENIEHIKNPESFLKKIPSLLKPNGLIIISTPNKKFTSGENPYHFNEYTYEGFEQLLKKYFQNIRIEGEYLKSFLLYPVYFLESFIPCLTLIPCILGKYFPKKSTVMIAICKNPIVGDNNLAIKRRRRKLV